MLDGGKCAIGLESTVVGFLNGVATILRPGSVTLAGLQKILPSAQLHSPASSISIPPTPGTKYRHYAPNATVVLSSSAEMKNNIRIALKQGKKTAVLCLADIISETAKVYRMDSIAQYAQKLYGIFHKCDTDGTEIIIAETMEEIGLALALMNRLKKAASGK